MQEIGYSSNGEAKQDRVRKTNTSQLEGITSISRIERQREEVVLLETGSWGQQALEPWLTSILGARVIEKM